MKRLRKIAFGKTLYHGTTLTALKNITENGMLLPQESFGGGTGGGGISNYEGFTFFAMHKEIALDYAISAMSSDAMVVIEVDLPEESLLPDDDDSPNSRTWQDSAREVGQVKVLGQVTTDYFKKIYFYDLDQNFVFESNFQNWEQNFEKRANEFDYNNENASESAKSISLLNSLAQDLRSQGAIMHPSYVENFSAKTYLDTLSKYFPEADTTKVEGFLSTGGVFFYLYNNDKKITVRYEFTYNYGADVVFKDEIDVDDLLDEVESETTLLQNMKIAFGDTTEIIMNNSENGSITCNDIGYILNAPDSQITASRLKKIVEADDKNFNLQRAVKDFKKKHKVTDKDIKNKTTQNPLYRMWSDYMLDNYPVWSMSSPAYLLRGWGYVVGAGLYGGYPNNPNDNGGQNGSDPGDSSSGDIGGGGES